jgi:formylglycine-generating enzyme required for sulfatase activity
VDSFDPQEPGQNKRILRGGSFLCSESYCARYILGSRGKGEPSSGSTHIGFRCAKSVDDRSQAGDEVLRR